MKWAIKKKVADLEYGAGGTWLGSIRYPSGVVFGWSPRFRRDLYDSREEAMAKKNEWPGSVLVRILSREESAAEKKGLRAEVKELADCASRLADSLESYNETSGDAGSVDTVDQYRDTGAQVDVARALVKRVGGGR